MRLQADLAGTPQLRALREELSAWLAEHVTDEFRSPGLADPTGAKGDVFERRRAWQRVLHSGGWVGVHWPAAHGGRSAGLMEHAVYLLGCAAAGALEPVNTIGINMVGPTLIEHGTDDQLALLPDILSADAIWSQLFSEPEAGSDLGAIATRARPLFEAALDGFERLGLPDGVGWCHDHLGWAAVAERDYGRARVHFERAVELARGDPLGEWLAAHALAALAPLVALSGDAEQALRLADEAIGVARSHPAPPVLAMAFTRAAEAAILAGRAGQARVVLAELLGVLANLATRRWVADALEMTALVLEDQGRGEQASEVLGAAEALREAAGETDGGLRVMAGKVLHARDRLVSALGAERFADHETRGRTLTPEAALTQALSGIAGCDHSSDR